MGFPIRKFERSRDREHIEYILKVKIYILLRNWNNHRTKCFLNFKLILLLRFFPSLVEGKVWSRLVKLMGCLMETRFKNPINYKVHGYYAK